MNQRLRGGVPIQYVPVAGPPGPPGKDGQPGPPGADGAPGVVGNVWRYGSGVPSDALGANGDWYLDADTGDAYVKDGGSYVFVMTLGGGTGLPPGGGVGEVLVKQSGTDGDADWEHIAGARGNMFTQAPAVPDAWDDEFTGGSADLATRGWTVLNHASGAAVTRVGEVAPRGGVASLLSNEYRSSITPGGMLVQTHADGLIVFKPWTGSGMLYADFRINLMSSTVYTMKASIWEVSPPVANESDSTQKQIGYFAYNKRRSIVHKSGVSSWTGPMPDAVNEEVLDRSDPWSAGTIDWVSSGGTYAAALHSPTLQATYAYSTSTFSFTPSCAGLQITCPSVGNTYQWATVRTLRRYLNSTFPGIP